MMRLAKSIDELYAEAKEYDIVITSDASLSAALNRRIDTPRIGNIAYAPRDIARKSARRITGKRLIDDYELASQISKETGYTFIQTYDELLNIKRIMAHTLDVTNHLRSKKSIMIYNAMMSLPAVESIMVHFSPDDEYFKGKKTAIIGLQFFDALERKVVPSTYDEIDAFKDAEYEIDEIYQVGNDRQIAENIAEIITPETASKTAVVTSSRMEGVIKSELLRKGILYRSIPTPGEISYIKDFIKFLNVSLDFEFSDISRIKDVFDAYDIQINETGKISEATNAEGKAKEVLELMKNISQYTMEEVCNALLTEKARDCVMEIINYIGYNKKKISRTSTDEFSYIVSNVNNIPDCRSHLDINTEGVIISNNGGNKYLDRPVVIYAGLDRDWCVENYSAGYIDVDKETKKEADRLEILIQQGKTKAYLVNTTRNGKESRPCDTFKDMHCFDEVKSFVDICSTVKRGTWCGEKVKKSLLLESNAEFKELKGFSHRGYSNYSKCPMKFMLKKTIPKEYNGHRTLLEEYVEFLICYRDIAEKNGVAYYQNMIVSECGMSDECVISKIRTYIRNVSKLISVLNPNVTLDIPAENNRFMEHHGCSKKSSQINKFLKSKKCPISAKAHLVTDEYALIIKTTKLADPKKPAEHVDWKTAKTYADFEVFTILSAENAPDTVLLFYVCNNELESTMDDFDIMQNIVKVRLDSKTQKEYLTSNPDAITKKLSAKKYSHIVNNPDALISIMSSKETKDDTALMKSIGSAYNITNENDIKTVLSKASNVINEQSYYQDNEVFVFSDAMEEFISMVSEDFKKASEEMRASLPGKDDCDRCSCSKFCIKEAR